MKLVELKIKRKSLAEEARIIRAEEKKVLLKATFARGVAHPASLYEDGSPTLNGLTPKQIARVMALRDRAGNNPPDPAVPFALYTRLNSHRRGDLRNAARAAILAHHYLKGTAYSKVETGKTEPVFAAELAVNVAREVRTFGGSGAKEVRPKDILHWFEGGPTIFQEAAAAEAAAQAAE